MSVHFKSERTTWETPPDVFDKLDAEFGFTLDVCATADNAKCKRYFTPDDDGLSQDWGRETCWMNPPYGREIGEWIRKAYESNALVVALLPARTDTKWFHNYIYEKASIRFIKGRIRFVGATSGAPFPSMVVIWRHDRYREPVRWWTGWR